MRVFEEDLDRIAQELKKLGLRNKSFFITGATGLVGSVLIKSLVFANEHYDLKNEVIAEVRNLEKAKKVFNGYKDIVFSVGDVREAISYTGDVDYIVHAASETKSKNMIDFPVETLWIALSGAKNLLDFAYKKKIKKMVFLSSMEAFGTVDTEEKVPEEKLGYIDLRKVRSCYPESKRMVENMCVCYSSEYGVPVTIARLAQTFGAGVPSEDTRVFAQFARSAMSGDDIVLHTTGESYGNYIYTADAAIAIFTLIKRGIGVGGSFDKVAYLAKKALLRPLDVPNPDPYYADLEKELLTAINELGIGPQGFGGKTTCLGLAIEQMPTHVAGLPVAVNVSCHVTRRASATL